MRFHFFLCLPAVLCLLTQPAFPQSWSGPTFKEFSGVNKMKADDLFFSRGVVGWDRPFGIFMNQVQPSRGVWDPAYLRRFREEALTLRKTGSYFLAPLLFMGWAGEDPTNTDHSAPLVETDWTRYVQYVVGNLHKAPYNVGYFQIWNEAVPDPKGWDVVFKEPGFFYDGTFDDYMNKIHLPAAKVIRDAGCKVVYGGYPGSKYTSPQRFIEMMNHYQAWGTVDIIDLHYFHWWDLELIHKAAVAAGYPNLGYWQTEWGYTTDPIAISSEYPFAIYWALTSGVWNAPDKFKYFYYSAYYTPDPGDEIPAHKKGLYDNNVLTAHGQILRNMSAVLGGGAISALIGVTGTGISHEKHSSIASFKVGDSTVILTVGLDSSDYAACTTTTLTIPIKKDKIVKAERIDLDGRHVIDISSALRSKGSRTELRVSTRDVAGSNAARWNGMVSGNSDLAVFYVRLRLTVGNRHVSSPDGAL